jgi:hypothetical protein
LSFCILLKDHIEGKLHNLAGMGQNKEKFSSLIICYIGGVTIAQLAENAQGHDSSS